MTDNGDQETLRDIYLTRTHDDIGNRLEGHEQAVREFNAGWDCAAHGGLLNDEPEDCPEDNWRNGFLACGAKAEIERLTHIIHTHLHERLCRKCDHEYWTAASAGGSSHCPKCKNVYTVRKGGR